DVLERARIEFVQPVATDLDLGDQVGFAQDAQVARDRRTADREIASDSAHGLAALAQQREDRAPGRVGERLEDVALVRVLGYCLVTHWLQFSCPCHRSV